MSGPAMKTICGMLQPRIAEVAAFPPAPRAFESSIYSPHPRQWLLAASPIRSINSYTCSLKAGWFAEYAWPRWARRNRRSYV